MLCRESLTATSSPLPLCLSPFFTSALCVSAPSAPEQLWLETFGSVVTLETHRFLRKEVWRPPPRFPFARPNLSPVASPHLY